VWFVKFVVKYKGRTEGRKKGASPPKKRLLSDKTQQHRPRRTLERPKEITPIGTSKMAVADLWGGTKGGRRGEGLVRGRRVVTVQVPLGRASSCRTYPSSLERKGRRVFRKRSIRAVSEGQAQKRHTQAKRKKKGLMCFLSQGRNKKRPKSLEETKKEETGSDLTGSAIQECGPRATTKTILGRRGGEERRRVITTPEWRKARKVFRSDYRNTA